MEKYSSAVSYPKTVIGQSLRGVAQVKLADLETRVFYTAHSSFDTHATQLGVHAQLWREIAEAITAFFTDLRTHDAGPLGLRAIYERAGLPTRLSECGVGPGIFSVLAEEAAQQWTARFNPRPASEADLRQLYEAAY